MLDDFISRSCAGIASPQYTRGMGACNAYSWDTGGEHRGLFGHLVMKHLELLLDWWAWNVNFHPGLTTDLNRPYIV